MSYKFNEQNFEEEVIQSELPVLVDFFASWCGPCKMMAPIIEELALEYEGKIKIGKMDIDENMNISSKYKVMSIPTLIIFNKGEAVETTVGVMQKNELKSKLERVLTL